LRMAIMTSREPALVKAALRAAFDPDRAARQVDYAA